MAPEMPLWILPIREDFHGRGTLGIPLHTGGVLRFFGWEGEKVGEVGVGHFEGEDVGLVGVFVAVVGSVPWF